MFSTHVIDRDTQNGASIELRTRSPIDASNYESGYFRDSIYAMISAICSAVSHEYGGIAGGNPLTI